MFAVSAVFLVSAVFPMFLVLLMLCVSWFLLVLESYRYVGLVDQSNYSFEKSCACHILAVLSNQRRP